MTVLKWPRVVRYRKFDHPLDTPANYFDHNNSLGTSTDPLKTQYADERRNSSQNLFRRHARALLRGGKTHDAGQARATDIAAWVLVRQR